MSDVHDAPDGAQDGLAALLTVKEVSRLLGVSGEAVRNHVHSGALHAYRLGDGPKARIRIPSSSVAAFLRDAHAARIESR